MDATVGTLGATEHGGSRLKGSALRHSVERLVLDTVFVTFGIIILIVILIIIHVAFPTRYPHR